MRGRYSRGYFEGFLSGIEAPQPSASSRKADCQFRVTISWAQFRNCAPFKKAPARLAPSSTALKKFAPSRWAREGSPGISSFPSDRLAEDPPGKDRTRSNRVLADRRDMIIVRHYP